MFEEPIIPNPLPLEPTPTNGATPTQPSFGDSEEVASTSVQPNKINYPTDHVQLTPPENEVLRSITRQRSHPSVPGFVILDMGQNLAHSIISIARADGFENSLVYGKRAIWLKDKILYVFVPSIIFARYQ